MSRYKIIRELGRGTGGRVLLAEDSHQNHRLVAIKLLPRNAKTDEFRVLRKLSHPNLARVLDSGRDNSHLFFVSDYVEGEDMVTASKKRDWNAVFQLIVQCVRALQYLKDHQIIHGDLKPANILVGKIHDDTPSSHRMGVKLIDFGLSYRSQDRKNPEQGGTLAYMAPEKLLGKEADHRSDLYSLGIILHEIAFEKRASAKTGGFARYLENLSHGSPDVSPMKDWGVPDGIMEIIRRTTEKSPGQRPSNPSELIEILNEREGESFECTPRGQRLMPLPQANVAAKCEAPLFLEPEEALRELQRLSRSGAKKEAVEFALPYLDRIAAWKEAGIVQDFYASAIHGLIELGRFREAVREISRMEKQGLVKSGSSLEPWLLKAHLAYRKGHLSESMKCLRGIPKSLVQKAGIERQVRYESQWALLAQESKHWHEAAQHYERASHLAEQSGRKDHRLSLLVNAASLYFRQGDWTRAYETFSESLKIARLAANPSLLSMILNNLGNLYLYFGRWREALESLQESLEISKSQGLKSLQAYNLYLLTIAEDGQGNWEHVTERIQEAMETARDLGEAQACLQTLLARGYFELSQKDFLSCRKTVEEVSGLARQAGQSSFMDQSLWLDLKLRMATGETTGVEPALKGLEERFRTSNDPNALWQVEADLAEFYEREGRVEDALRHGTTALKLLEDFRSRIPAAFRESYLRDRKKEKIVRLIQELQRKPGKRPQTISSMGPPSGVITFTFQNRKDTEERTYGNQG